MSTNNLINHVYASHKGHIYSVGIRADGFTVVTSRIPGDGQMYGAEYDQSILSAVESWIKSDEYAGMTLSEYLDRMFGDGK